MRRAARSLLGALAAVAVVATGTLAAQVVARQGAPSPPEVTRFDSPMILELPLPNLATLEAGAQAQLADVRKYVCDHDVTLRRLHIAKQRKGRGNDPALELMVSGSVEVADSYDRLVDIAVRIKNGDALVAEGQARNISAEEERATPFQLALPVDDAKLRDAFQSGPRPILELTLTVRDNS